MRKKHFAGVLMLTAAVALGTVSPAVLPNTAIEVRAQAPAATITYTINSANSGNYTGLNATVAEETGTLKLSISKANLSNTITDATSHTYGFGVDESTAIANAVKEDAKLVSLETDTLKIVATNVPEDAKYIAIVKKNSVQAGASDSAKTVVGATVDLTANRGTAPVDTTNYTNTATKGQATAVTKIEYRKAGTTEWKTANASAKFPETAVTEGKKEKYELRTPAGTDKLPSLKIAEPIEIFNAKPIGLDELRKFKFKLADNATLTVVNFADVKKELEENQAVSYSSIDTLKYDRGAAPTNQNFVANFSLATLAKDEEVKLYSSEDLTKKLTIKIAKPDTPKFEQVKDKYQLAATKTAVNSPVYKVVTDKAVKYVLTRDTTSEDVVPNDVASPATIDIKNFPGADTAYTLKVVPVTTTAVFAADKNETTAWLSSEAETIQVKKVDTALDLAKFNGIKLTTKDKKLIVSAASIAAVTDQKVTYSYAGKEGEVPTKTALELPLVDGEFVLKAGDGTVFKKTIKFKGLKNGAGQLVKNGDRYETPERFAYVFPIATAPVEYQKQVGKATPAAFAALAANTVLTEGEYKVRNTGITAEGNLTVANLGSLDYKLSDEITVHIGKEASTSNFRTPVIPGKATTTTPSTPATPDKKDEPKKDEPKKDESKKDDSKDTTPSTNPSTTTETKKATAKAAKVGLKVTDKKVTSVLKKSGTKLVAKTVYKATVKNNDGKAVKTTLKVKLSTKAKTVYVLDLKTGKTIKAAYKNGKVTFKTKKSIAKFVIVNKAAKK